MELFSRKSLILENIEKKVKYRLIENYHQDIFLSDQECYFYIHNGEWFDYKYKNEE